MSRETKNMSYVRLGEHYDVIRHYKMFGWNLDGYEKYKDWLGEAERSPKVTFFDLFFSRDKNATWYNKVCKLEKEYDDLCKNNFEEIKSKYNYEEKVKIGKKPINPNIPKLAEPSKFFKGTIIFIIGILMIFIGILLEGETQRILSQTGAVVIGIGMVVLLFKIKYLCGLKGVEKKKALAKQSKYLKDKEIYDKEVQCFFASRKQEIEKELGEILNF